MSNRAAYTTWLEDIAGWLTLCAPSQAGVQATVPTPERAIGVMQGWNSAVWPHIQQLVFMHGVGPYLHYTLPATPLYAALPPPFRTWLADQYQMNEARIQRMHEELGAILHTAQQHGIAIMPLKGSVLSLRAYARPALRPMADLDLLVQPADFATMSRLLQTLGYRLTETHSPHKVAFRHPNANRVVSYTTEHPDNPREVELLSQIDRRIWYQSTENEPVIDLFADSQAGVLLGYPVRIASEAAATLLYAIHLSKHLMKGTARLLQLLDLALVLPAPVTVPDAWANWIYPSLLLVQKVLPQPALHDELVRLATVVHPRIYRWCTQQQSLAASGMVLLPNIPQHVEKVWLGYVRVMWDFWRIDPWRMTLAYGDAPWPVAYRAYLQQMSRRAFHKVHRLVHKTV